MNSMEWISTNDNKPQVNKKVYVVIQVPKHGGGFLQIQTTAVWIAKLSLLEEDFMHEDHYGEGDYSEEQDAYYTPEGWYEYQYEPEMQWKISKPVTHYCELFAMPAIVTT